MRRINRLPYAQTGPGSRGSDPLSAPAAERRSYPPSPAAEDPERVDSSDVWSAWIDLGGEG